MRISDWSSDVCSSDLWKCQKLSGYRGASSARRPRANDRTNPASAPTRRTSSVTTLPRLAALCLPLALAAAPAYASQEPVEPMQPDDPLLDRKSTRLNSSH